MDTFYLEIKYTKTKICFSKETNRKRLYTPNQLYNGHTYNQSICNKSSLSVQVTLKECDNLFLADLKGNFFVKEY